MDDQLRMRLAYIEDSISRLVQELKQNKCLSQEFEFLTEAEIDQKYDFVRSKLNCADKVGQLAEEASELCHAALKLERVLRGTNPTPVTKPEAIQKVLEETGDVLNCLEVLRIYPDTESIAVIRSEKMDRWIRRLKENENA